MLDGDFLALILTRASRFASSRMISKLFIRHQSQAVVHSLLSRSTKYTPALSHLHGRSQESTPVKLLCNIPVKEKSTPWCCGVLDNEDRSVCRRDRGVVEYIVADGCPNHAGDRRLFSEVRVEGRTRVLSFGDVRLSASHAQGAHADSVTRVSLGFVRASLRENNCCGISS